MTPKQRLLLAGFCFLAWIGYLGYLVSITRDPVILSRPQFLVADAYVLAELQAGADEDHPKREVKILKVYWAKDDNLKKLVDSTISVRGLDLCESANGWVLPGTYILPLTKEKAGYELTRIPLSPGFYQKEGVHNELLIYHAADQALEQLKNLIAEFH